jgi:hypothetical protein
MGGVNSRVFDLKQEACIYTLLSDLYVIPQSCHFCHLTQCMQGYTLLQLKYCIVE